MSQIAIQMRGVGRDAVGRNSGQDRTTILHDIDFELAQGSLLHIVGPSGSGKSTLLRLIIRLDDADRGEIRIDDQPIGDWPVRKLRRHVAMMLQESSMLGQTVRQNLRLPFEVNRDTADGLESRIEDVMKQVELDTSLLDRDGNELSVGQKQRVALARTLISEPRVLLLDEPTSSLDARTAEALLDRIGALREQRGLSIVSVTHQIAHARRLGGRMIVLIDGRIAAAGPVADIVSHPPNAEVKRFIYGDDDAGSG